METAVEAGPNSARIEALDFVRGCALFGILLMNIVGMGLAEAYYNPTNAGGATGADLWAWIITEIGFEGTQRALFSMLFGAGVLLFTSRAEASGRGDGVDLFLRRTLLLIGFGMINAWVLLWDGDILYAYGLTGLFVVAFRKLSVRTLLIVGAAGMLFNAALNARDATNSLAAQRNAAPALAAAKASKPLTPEQTQAKEAWEEIASQYVAKPEDIAETTKAVRGGYLTAFPEVAATNSFMQSWFMYRYFFDIFSMMLIGMALLKGGVLTLEAPARLYWAMLIGGYAIGLVVNIAETRWIFSATAFAQAAISYDLSRLAMTTGHLGALLLFCRSGALAWLRTGMAAVGRMALTNYLMHSVIALILFVGFGLFGTFARHQLYYIVLAIWVFQLVSSPIWLRHFRFGPIEWVWRGLTYGRAPPFRKRPPTVSRLAPAE
jgi:uncharacterized protein